MYRENTSLRVPHRRNRWLRLGWRIGFVAALVWVAHWAVGIAMARIGLLESGAADQLLLGVMITVLLAYTLLMAVPFLPGIEIGVGLLMAFGASVAPLVYAATVLGLSLAYLTGYFIALGWLVKTCEDLSLRRLAALLQRIAQTPQADRLADLQSRLPRWLPSWVLRFRYLALALAINMPGNFALGGGGGILLAAGVSRLFSPWLTVLTIAIATLPVPLAVWSMGMTVKP